MKVKQTLISSVLATSLLVGAGAALAQDDSTTAPDAPGVQQQFQGQRGPRNGGQGQQGIRPGVQMAVRLELRDLADMAQEYTGLSLVEIRDAYQNGQTLAQLIEANGQSVDAFIAAAIEDINARIDTAVENGNLDAARAETLKANVEARVSAYVNEGPQANGQGPGGPAIRRAVGLQLYELAELSEEYTGLTLAELREAHQSGQTLAELIEANGQSVDAFVAAAIENVSARIDTAVENGNLDADRAATLKATIEARVTARVNGEAPGPWQMPPITDDAV